MADLAIDAGTAADIAKFEQQLERYLAGDLDDDVFRVFRLNNGIYGQRQGGHNQMVRIKAPGGVITAAQLDRMADVAKASRHHPDFCCRYDVVDVAVTTRSAGGVTSADLSLARAIETAASIGAP